MTPSEKRGNGREAVPVGNRFPCFHLRLPVVSLTLERFAFLRAQGSQGISAPQFMARTAPSGLRQLQVWRFDKPEPLMPGDARFVRQVVSARQRLLSGLKEKIHRGRHQRRRHPLPMPLWMHKEQIEPGAFPIPQRQRRADQRPGIRRSTECLLRFHRRRAESLRPNAGFRTRECKKSGRLLTETVTLLARLDAPVAIADLLPPVAAGVG
jgi:hypothetical protein